MTRETLLQQRRQLAGRPRRILFNNDGCDCLYFPREQKATADSFLARRTADLPGTHVDTIAYCTISAGFGNFTHRTHVGEELTRSASEFGIHPRQRNCAQDLIEQGTDCLQEVLSFAHRHKMELFWSMRMNDTHDADHRPQRPHFLFPDLKEKHPKWLVGKYFDRLPYGRWSSVDYARPEIRDLAFRYVEEVCLNYEVDGVELDFFRHPCYYKSVARGGKASAQERKGMTGLLAKIRATTEQVGLRRGRPILVAVRVPDSVEYCGDLGLDIEHWLERGLVDLLVTTCYFQLNPWEYSVALGHKYGVPVYPCLSDSRVKGETRFHRNSVESYRGRAMNAWAAGADGIHLFNVFDVPGRRSPLFRELGDPKALRTLDKLYFVTTRDGNPEKWLAGGTKYRSTSLFTPKRPRPVAPGHPLALDITVGDDLSAGDVEHAAQVTCHVALPQLSDAGCVRVKFNDRQLQPGKLANGWLDVAVASGVVKRGVNRVEIAVDSPAIAAAPDKSHLCRDLVLRVAFPKK